MLLILLMLDFPGFIPFTKVAKEKIEIHGYDIMPKVSPLTRLLSIASFFILP